MPTNTKPHVSTPTKWLHTTHAPILGVPQILPYSTGNLVKQLLFATRVPGHGQLVGRPCGPWMHYATRDVIDGAKLF